MTDAPVRRKRRPHAAAASRALVTGVSASAMFGMVAGLAAADGAAPPPARRRVTAPAPAARSHGSR